MGRGTQQMVVLCHRYCACHHDEDDYVKAGNYWRWLKKKLNAEGIQLVSVTHDFKFQAPDGKQRFADREIFKKGIDYSYYYEQEY